ncbi:MAG: PH domain-containing protein [Methylocystaceae bacterium]
MRFTITKMNGIGWGLLLGVLFFVPVLLGPQLALPTAEDYTFKMLLTIPMCLLLLLYVYALIALLTMKYWIDDKNLHIRWGIRHKVIPLKSINEIVDYQTNPNLGVMVGYSWPGHILGYYNVIGTGVVDFFGGDWKKGMAIIHTDVCSVALTPDDRNSFLNTISASSGVPVQTITEEQAVSVNHDDELFEETIERIDQDKGYKTLIKVNIGLIIAMIAFLAIFYPGSGVIPLILVFPGLAISMFVFIMGISSRMYQIMPTMAYAMFILPIMVSLVFIIISILIISFY